MQRRQSAKHPIPQHHNLPSSSPRAILSGHISSCNCTSIHHNSYKQKLRAISNNNQIQDHPTNKPTPHEQYQQRPPRPHHSPHIPHLRAFAIPRSNRHQYLHRHSQNLLRKCNRHCLDPRPPARWRGGRCGVEFVDWRRQQWKWDCGMEGLREREFPECSYCWGWSGFVRSLIIGSGCIRITGMMHKPSGLFEGWTRTSMGL